MVTSSFEWKILEWDKNPQNKTYSVTFFKYMVVHEQNVAKPQYGQKRFTRFPPQFNFLHILNTFISPYCVVVGGRIGFFSKIELEY